MPTYQYECAACGYQFETIQSITENRLKKCPKCHKNKLDRLIGTGSGIIFKGSGFYETDYKKKIPSAKDKGPSKDTGSKKSSNGKSTTCPHKDSCGCCP